MDTDDPAAGRPTAVTPTPRPAAGPGAPATDGQRADGGSAVRALMGRAVSAAAYELCAVASEVAAPLGATAVRIYLVDYSQRYLRSTDPDHVDELPVEGTLAGRAFVTGEPTAAAEPHQGTWFPLIDGSDRLGAAHVGHEGDAHPLLAPFVHVLSELVVSKNLYSDWFKRCRRRQDLTLSAELQWRQLPPLTYARPAFAVAGVLEPAYDIGGDAFDYGDNPEGLRFSITDALGHGTPAMLLSAAAMTVLRHSRTHALPLADTYRAVGSVLATQFGGHRYVTGILAQFDTRSQELRWLNAGHPLPLLLRDRKVVGPLACAPSLPMGLGGDVVEVATQSLQPGDRVLFYTDGVTEARRRDEQFGVDRLADYLQRTTLDGLGPAETMRRLSLAVLAHHDFTLGDDSSMLMLEVRGPARPG